MKKKVFYALPALLWSIAIIFLTLQPAEVSSDLSGGIVSYVYTFIETLTLPISFDAFHFLVRKAAHFTEYFILGMFLLLAFMPYNLKRKALIVFVLIIGVTFASIDETIQLYVPGRHGSVIDVLIDSMGVLFSVVCFIIGTRLRRVERV